MHMTTGIRSRIVVVTRRLYRERFPYLYEKLEPGESNVSRTVFKP